MKLSLSVRVAESFNDKTKADMTLEQLAELAVTCGYHAVCMRASQLGTHSSAEEVQRASEMLARRGLAVSMVTGDFAIPQNSDVEAPRALRNITPYLDLSAALGADLMRICMKRSEDIQWAQRAADEKAILCRPHFLWAPRWMNDPTATCSPGPVAGETRGSRPYLVSP